MREYVIYTKYPTGAKSYVAWSNIFGLSYCNSPDMAGVVIFDSIEDVEYSLQQLIGATDTPHFFEYLKG